MSRLDSETKRKLREMGVTVLLDAFEAQDDTLTLGMAFEERVQLVVDDAHAAFTHSTVLNPAYAQLAEHYGTAIIPARVKRPRDKAVVEGSVRFVAGQVAAILRDRQFVGLAELNEAVFDEVAAINARPFQKREDSRLVVFERDEKPLLVPLPSIGSYRSARDTPVRRLSGTSSRPTPPNWLEYQGV